MDAASYNQYTDHNQTNPLHLRIHGALVIEDLLSSS